MSKVKFIGILIALLLCVSMVFSVVVLAAGDENQDSATGESTGQTPGETPSETPSETPDPEPDPEPNPEPDPEPDPEPVEPGDGKMHISDAMLEVLKQLEGFSPHAYWDYSQYSIGYGSECPKGKEKYYMSKEDGGEGNKITEEYAEELLRQELDYFEDTVNKFMDCFEDFRDNLVEYLKEQQLYVADKKDDDINIVQLVSFGCGVDAITTDEMRSILEKGNRIYTQIKIDEISNPGAVKIRLRSLFAATGR
mgnify:CR=1 FL=1